MSYNNGINMSTTDSIDSDGFVTYYPLALIIAGTLLNSLTLVILCRPTFRDTARRPTIHYMRAMTILDSLMLYGWNFDHYLSGAFGFTLQGYSISSCKIFSFINYFAPQVSAWLRVFICVDRYLALSRLHKTWFGHSKNVLIIIACIIIVFTLINLHILIFVCFYASDGTLNEMARFYNVYPLWDYVNLGLYNCIPFICMVILNSSVIYQLIRIRQASTVRNSRIQHRSISITLVITTFLFLIMTTPATVAFAFFESMTSYVILHLMDSMLFTYHILSFPLYMITFTEFQQEVIRLITCNRFQRVEPTVYR